MRGNAAPGALVATVMKGSALEDDPEETADKLGLHMVLPGRDELFIDADAGFDMDRYEAMRDVLHANGVLTEEVRITESKTPGNLHIVLRLKNAKLSPTARVAFQACLGSDPKREVLALLRIGYKTNRPATIFFEKELPIEIEPPKETPVAKPIEDDDIPF
jgi:hypothetical protein